MGRKAVGEVPDEKDFLIDKIISIKDHLKAIRDGVSSIPDLGKHIMHAEFDLLHAAEAIRKSREQEDNNGEKIDDRAEAT